MLIARAGKRDDAGRKSLNSTVLTSDLPPEAPTLMQAFLFALMFDMTFVTLVDRARRAAEPPPRENAS